jgi:hypothetical protein
VAPRLYHHVVIRNESAAGSFIQAMLSKLLPQLRTFVHTLVVPRIRYTQYHLMVIKKDETYRAMFETAGYYPDGPSIIQIDQILQWLSHSTCRQSWQNLLVHQNLLEITTYQSPPNLTLTGIGENHWMYLGVSNVRRLRFPDYMPRLHEADHIRPRFLSLTHLGMVVYKEPPMTRQIVDILLQSRTLERLAVVIVPPPFSKSTEAGSMGNAIYRELLEVDDERLVVLEEEISLLKMLRQPDGIPFWRRVREVADHTKKNGKPRPPYLL